VNTADLSRAQMRAILKDRGVKGAASMLRPQCETLLADVAEEGYTLADVTAGRVPTEVLDGPDEGPSAEWEARWHGDEEHAVTEVTKPARKPSYYVCGACSSAPRHRDRDGAHLTCRSDVCQCSLLNHRPDAKVRAIQAKVCAATVEQCEAVDPGRLVNA
jgi:hypothetical protein